MTGLTSGGFWLAIFIIGRTVQIPATEVWQGTLANMLSTGVLLGWLLSLLLLLSAVVIRLVEKSPRQTTAQAAEVRPGQPTDF